MVPCPPPGQLCGVSQLPSLGQAGNKSTLHSSLCGAVGSRTWLVLLISALSGRLHLLHPPCLPLPLAACDRALPLAETKIALTELLKCQDGAELGPSADKLPCAVAGRCGPSLGVIRASPGGAVDKICCRAVTLACQPSPADHPLSWVNLGKALVLVKGLGLYFCVVGVFGGFICHMASSTA